ncbi:hypothetical protein [Pseudooceanicola sp.]|uniref:hypothetical protein n=1 Tax=Pseudooceanicola sp. TaxID=1914328 RepID=UPI003519990D
MIGDRTVTVERIMEKFEQLDQVEKIIFYCFAKQLAKSEGPMEELQTWANDLVDRYRNGEELTVSDLKI